MCKILAELHHITSVTDSDYVTNILYISYKLHLTTIFHELKVH